MASTLWELPSPQPLWNVWTREGSRWPLNVVLILHAASYVVSSEQQQQRQSEAPPLATAEFETWRGCSEAALASDGGICSF
eukprot:6180663-Pleurochrysis_carterae.AAC.5